jgi:lipopolysaccharide/colanic/teichoic acid biosynthesis glycosyltransferase
VSVTGKSRGLRQTFDGESVAIGSGIPPGVARRLLDVALSASMLVVLSPLLVLVALAVRLSGGTALFRQSRVGQGGIPFTMYKFRTMIPGSPGPLVTAPGDPRITRIGRLLRATKIDELPQFLNILLGDMTLVGARPEAVGLAGRYPAECRAVFRYRPGLTGPGQLWLPDWAVLPRPEDAEVDVDVDEHYLGKVVPGRAPLDIEYLERPTIRRTVGLLVETLLPARFRSRRPGEGLEPSSNGGG